jgi:hypothetical protein
VLKYVEKSKGGTTVKKWKIILSIIVLIIAIGAGTVYYFFNIKEYKTADKKVEEIVETEYDIKLPGEDNTTSSPAETTEEQAAAIDESGSSAESSSEGTTSDASQQKGNNNSSSTTTSSSTPTDKGQQAAAKPTAAAIIEKYKPTFHELESQADGKLNSLVSYAFSEYSSKKASGEKVSYGYFYSKYTSAAETLEAGTDAAFNYVYNALVNELKKSGYSANEAQSIKDQYNSMKKQRRSALMSKAMSYAK